MPACRCVVQDCSNKSNPRIGISLHTPKSNYELAKWKPFVRTHSSNFKPKGLFKICSVYFSSDCFERTVLIEGAPRRLIARSIPTIWKPSTEGTSNAISARSRSRVLKEVEPESDMVDEADHGATSVDSNKLPTLVIKSNGK
ncbi:uncharacterized protein [Montipora foliosa]|uniref:uncharacterized protein n=1 Tax=Montipora foliosa TaxID=591990 RepID=UPI0035F14690